MEDTFEDWLNSDNVIKFKNEYRTQCTLYTKVFTLEELREYYKKEYSF